MIINKLKVSKKQFNEFIIIYEICFSSKICLFWRERSNSLSQSMRPLSTKGNHPHKPTLFPIVPIGSILHGQNVLEGQF